MNITCYVWPWMTGEYPPSIDAKAFKTTRACSGYLTYWLLQQPPEWIASDSNRETIQCIQDVCARIILIRSKRDHISLSGPCSLSCTGFLLRVALHPRPSFSRLNASMLLHLHGIFISTSLSVLFNTNLLFYLIYCYYFNTMYNCAYLSIYVQVTRLL